jgi:TPP-dependent pyruvate/acetoin dehydrogenase alpha subunit
MTPRKKRPGTAPVPPPGESGFSLISNRKLVALYVAMLKCRLLERRIREERLAAAPRTRGREAVAAGVATHLHAADRVFAADWSVLPGFVQKGAVAPVLDGLRAVRGARSGMARGAALWEEVLANARAMKRAKKKRVAAVFCGLIPAPAEALRCAAAERLPILFVCHQKGTRKKTPAVTAGSKMPAIPVDCEDAVAIYRVAAEALAHARRGNGPTLIECTQWKVARRTQTGSGAVRGSGAMRAMERYLAGKGLWSAKLKEETMAEFARELERNRAASKKD